MTTGVLTVQTGTPLTRAAACMAEHNVSSLPVVDVDNKLIGIITESDFLAALNIKEDSVYHFPAGPDEPVRGKVIPSSWENTTPCCTC